MIPPKVIYIGKDFFQGLETAPIQTTPQKVWFRKNLRWLENIFRRRNITPLKV